jgi:hypothetical protein
LVVSQNIQLRVQSKNNTNKQAFDGITYKTFHENETSIAPIIDSVLIQLQKGYLQSKLDTIYKKDSLFLAEIETGKQIEIIRIFYDKNSSSLNNKIIAPISSKVTENYFQIPFEKISTTMDYLLQNIEKQGKTFSKLQLKNIRFEESLAFADLDIQQTKPRKIDKVLVKGYDKFPKNFIPFDLNLKLNTTFTSKKLKDASNAIQNLDFVDEIKPPEVLFTKDSTIIYLYMKKKNTNRFDGLIGFTSKEEGNGLEFNGYLDLLFHNIFNSGETVSLFWKNNGNESQRFNFSAETPYLFNLPIIPKASFQIFRQDSSYTNILATFNMSYLINNRNKSNLAFSTETSNDLLRSANKDFSIQNFTNTFYGIGHTFRLLNDDYLFHEKFNLTFSAFFGNRKTDIENTKQTKFNLETNYLWTLNFKNYLYLKNQSAILNSNTYITNELFRIGGIKTIRGFNEESIFASAFSITNLEYRYKTTNSSYFYTITDFAYIENQILSESNKLYSLGLGYSFETKMGNLNISYAIGKFEDNPFILNESKLHIQLISFF